MEFFQILQISLEFLLTLVSNCQAQSAFCQGLAQVRSLRVANDSAERVVISEAHLTLFFNFIH